MGSVPMRYLSLFSGACGGDLAMQHLLGFRCLGYVEYEPYCQKVIKQRITDGLLDAAPIFGDIRNFISENYAASYTGLVDVITGGFPCQAWSNAASGKNNAESKWPEMLRVIGIVQPPFVFAENVDEGAIIEAQSDLASSGYKTRRCKLSAKDLGADHNRNRWWLLAYPNDKGKLLSKVNAEMAMLSKLCNGFWDAYANESGMVDGDSNRMDRYRAIGNGQVPIVAATAWRVLTNDQNLHHMRQAVDDALSIEKI